MKRMPQPIPYQGSKRNIAWQILSIFPKEVNTLVEPFAGSAAVSVAAAHYGKAKRFYLNDLNKPLMDLFTLIINEPHKIADAYERLWQAQLGREREYYDFIRDEFNKTERPDYLIYLLARCVKASVRYNASGEFNQSPDNRRKGRRPLSMRREILGVSKLLNGRAIVKSGDYRETIKTIAPSDLLYLDPPYQGTSQNKDPRYYSGLDLSELADFLAELNRRQVLFILSYDGRTGNKKHGATLPQYLNLQKLEICAGRSSQSTLLGKNAKTFESLYLSSALVHQLQASNRGDFDPLTVLERSQAKVHPQQLELGII